MIQTEFSLYNLLKAWVFLQLNPDFEGERDVMAIEVHKFFRTKKVNTNLTRYHSNSCHRLSLLVGPVDSPADKFLTLQGEFLCYYYYY